MNRLGFEPAVCLALMLAGALVGGCAGQANSPAAAPQANAAVRAWVDPVTGELREPTAGEQAAAAKGPRATAQAAGTAPREASETELPGGGYALHTAQPIQHEMTACLRADGSVQLECPERAGR